MPGPYLLLHKDLLNEQKNIKLIQVGVTRKQWEIRVHEIWSLVLSYELGYIDGGRMIINKELKSLQLTFFKSLRSLAKS